MYVVEERNRTTNDNYKTLVRKRKEGMWKEVPINVATEQYLWF